MRTGPDIHYGLGRYFDLKWLGGTGPWQGGPVTLQPGNGGSQCAINGPVAATGRRLVELGLLEGDLEDAAAQLGGPWTS